MRALLLIAALLTVAPSVEARRGSGSSSKSGGKVCKKGKACGNSCIARSATCHQEKGSATNADEPKPTESDVKKPPAPSR